MKRTHWKIEMRYLNGVAGFLQRHGYEVEEPTTGHRDLLDIWGKLGKKKCFIEIYCHHIVPMKGGIYGIWTVDTEDEEDGCVEVWMDHEGGFYNSDSSSLLCAVANQIKPMRRRK